MQESFLRPHTASVRRRVGPKDLASWQNSPQVLPLMEDLQCPKETEGPSP